MSARINNAYLNRANRLEDVQAAGDAVWRSFSLSAIDPVKESAKLLPVVD